MRFPTGLFLFEFRAVSIGALVIRIGFWGSVYYSYNKKPPRIILVVISAPTVS